MRADAAAGTGRPRRASTPGVLDARGLRAARRRFAEIFPARFRDETYVAWERRYKWEAHRLWRRLLGRGEFATLLRSGAHREIAARAIAVYARPKLNLLALYEWMALRDALGDDAGARRFAPALYDVVYGADTFQARFGRFVEVLDGLPQRQTGLCKWPVATVFPFLAVPARHFIVKPNLLKRAAAQLGVDLPYRSRPNWETYRAVLALAGALRRALASWRPRDLIDVQGFVWVTNSDEYADWPWD